MSAVWAWIRLDIRHRARSLVVLALLVAMTTGVVLAAVAGARRGESALDRLQARTLPATVAALPNEPGFDWDAVAALPGVEAVGRFAIADFAVDGVPREVLNFPYADGTMVDIERPVVLEGRLADPSRDDEAVITAKFEGTAGKGVGDVVTLRLFTPEQVDAFHETGVETEPAGPVIETTIVGVVRSTWFSDVGYDSAGSLIPSNGLFAKHEANLIGASKVGSVNALVRLAGGATAVPAFREDLAELSGRRDIEFLDLASEVAYIGGVAGFEADALRAFAAAALIAACFLVGQSVVRYVAVSTQDLRVLQAVGLTPRQVRLAAAAAPTIAALGGAVIGAIGAVVASSRFPMGTAAPLEPDPGRHVDLPVLLAGLMLVPALVALGTVAASWSVSRTFAAGAPSRRSTIAGLLARAGAPIPVSIGSSFALDRGRGTQAVPVLPALIGSIVGVLGVVAALTFAHGVNDAAAHPERFGQIFDAQAFVGFNDTDFGSSDAVVAAMAADPEVLAVNDTRQGVLESGTVDLPAFVIDPVDAMPGIVVLDGGLPAGPDEVTIATATAADLDAAVGDRIELSGSNGTGTYRVSGIAFVPEAAHSSYDAGAWMGPSTYDELIKGFKFHTVDAEIDPSASADEVVARLGVAVAEAVGAPPEAAAEMVFAPAPPSRLGELQQIRRLPLLLAGFLAVLAIGAVGHALATAVHRRRHDLAVLRSVGVTRWQSRAVVLIQATVLALVGLTLGVPLGFALGRTLWRSMAESTPMDHVPPVAVWALVLIGPAALLIATVLAVWPSHRAASLRIAHVLRTE